MLTIPQIKAVKAVKAEVRRMFAEGELLKIEDPPPCGFCAEYGIQRTAEMIWNKDGEAIHFCRGCFEVEGVT